MNFLVWNVWNWLALVVGVMFASLGAFLLARWSWRWFLVVILAIVCVLFLFVLPWRFPAPNFLDPDLPPLFLNHFWAWVLAFILGIVVSFGLVVRMLRAVGPAGQAEAAPSDLAGKFPDIEAAWDEVQVRLHQASIDPAAQRVFLILGPSEDWPAALVHSAGLQLFAEAPDSPAPLHAYATGEGILLGASGASAFGTQSADGMQRVERLCRLLAASSPECPSVRGVVVLFPIGWAGQPESVKWAAALRDDLRVVQRVLKVRCPVFAVFPEMELTPGFGEFCARMPVALRQSRCGFAVPRSQPFSGDLMQRGLTYMAGWFHGWVLSLMSDDLFNQAGNNLLFSLDHEVRRYRKRLRAILESAFSTHREAEPILFRGCYFAATGAGPNEHAFSAGLLRGPRGRVIADQLAAEWSREAEDDDRRDRRLAVVVGLGGGLLILLSWAYIIAVTANPWWGLGPGALVVAWVIALVRIGRM